MKTNRRTFLAGVGAAGILAGGEQARQLQLVRPRRLRAGDTVGLVTPATPTAAPAAAPTPQAPRQLAAIDPVRYRERVAGAELVFARDFTTGGGAEDWHG